MRTLVVEGWRFIAHSYAVVNQFQCLAMLDRGDIDLYHRDAAFFSQDWRRVEGLFPPGDEQRLAKIPAPPDDLRPDVVLRIAAPMDLRPAAAGRTVVFGTTERGVIPEQAILPESRVFIRTGDTHIVTPSAWSQDGFLRGGVPRRRISIVPHGVDVRMYAPLDDGPRTAARHALGWHDQIVFLHCSAMTPNKNVELQLRMFAALLQTVPRCRLVFKGNDDLYDSRSRLEAAMLALAPDERMRVQPRVQYIGGTSPFSALAQLYQAADVYLAPYRAEGFNIPVLEAAACGLTIICSAGGPTDDFTTGEFALRVPSTIEPLGGGARRLSPDPKRLLQCMQRAATDQKFRAQARMAGPRIVAQSWTWTHAVDRLANVLWPAS